jgi:hypothetical protein
MSYESETLRYISKHTGLTGIESKNLYHKMEKKNIDFQTIDWETVGQDMYGHGHRTKGAKNVIRGMYGISFDEHEDQSQEYLEREVHQRQSRRTPRSLHIDNLVNAKHVFKITNPKGVAKWLKNPNRFDIKGIDDIIKF